MGSENNIASVKSTVDKIASAASSILHHSNHMKEASGCRDNILNDGINSVSIELSVRNGGKPIVLKFTEWENKRHLERINSLLAELMADRINDAQAEIAELSVNLQTP